MATILIEVSDSDDGDGMVNIMIHPYETARSHGNELEPTPAEDMVAEMLEAAGVEVGDLTPCGGIQ